MVIEPRRVAPGYIKRWAKESMELIGRSFHLWFGMAVVFSLLAWASDQAGLFGMSLVVAVFFFAVSSEIAAISDNEHLDISDLPSVFMTAGRQAVHEAWTHRRGIVLFILAIPVVVYLLVLWSTYGPAKPPAPPPAPVDYGSLHTWVFSSDSPFASLTWAAFISANLYGYTGLNLSGLRYPLRRTFELSEEAADHLSLQAAQKNADVTVNLPLLLQGILMGALLLMPILGLFIICFIPAMNYVAFREMFIDDKGNRKAVRKTATKLAIQGAS